MAERSAKAALGVQLNAVASSPGCTSFSQLRGFFAQPWSVDTIWPTNQFPHESRIQAARNRVSALLDGWSATFCAPWKCGP
jgi:hypothetical protein